MVLAISRVAFQELVGRLPGLHATMEQSMTERMGRPVVLNEEMATPEPR